MSASLLPSTPPVQCAPIYKIEYAQHKPDYGPMPRKPYLPVPDDTHSAVNDALKLALQLLVHPQSIKVVAQLICDSESESDIEATRRAIHKILADTKWYIGLSDQYRAKGDYAWYTRCEPRLARTTWARTLYLSERVSGRVQSTVPLSPPPDVILYTDSLFITGGVPMAYTETLYKLTRPS